VCRGRGWFSFLVAFFCVIGGVFWFLGVLLVGVVLFWFFVFVVCCCCMVYVLFGCCVGFVGWFFGSVCVLGSSEL
jgi:hypothetical protein